MHTNTHFVQRHMVHINADRGNINMYNTHVFINRAWNVCKQIDYTHVYSRAAATHRGAPWCSQWLMDIVRVKTGDTREHPFISVAQLIPLSSRPLRHSASPRAFIPHCASVANCFPSQFVFFPPWDPSLLSLPSPTLWLSIVCFEGTKMEIGSAFSQCCLFYDIPSVLWHVQRWKTYPLLE